MEKGIEKQLNREEEKKLEQLRAAKEEFKQWKEKEIEEDSPDSLQLKAIDEKDIPDEYFKLFIMYKAKEEDFDWEEYGPLEEKIENELKKKENNSRRVFYKLFANKLRPRVAGTELKEEREQDYGR